MAGEFSKPVLYSYFRSSASWRVRTALAYKGIDYEYKAVNLVKDDQLSDDYKKLNPSRQVPTLLIDGLVLTQSLPIIEYLEETRPEKNLLPANPAQRHKARQIAEIVNSGIQPIQNMSVLKHINELVGEEKKLEWAKRYIRLGFESLEDVLKDSAGRFCVGDNVTIADLFLVPQVANAKRFNVELTDFPIIRRINEECLAQEFFKIAAPSAQSDCPVDAK